MLVNCILFIGVIFLEFEKIELEVRNVVGGKVETVRKQKGLTQKDLADKLSKKGVPISTSGLSKLEKQVRRVTDIEIVALSEVLGVSVNYLLDVKDE